MKAGIYARISDDREGQALGVTRQIEDCQGLAASRGWGVVRTYVDNDISASKGKPRPEYESLLVDLKAGRIQAVVTYDLDRLTRRPAELEAFMTLADEKEVSLANVSGDIDLNTSSGRFMARIKGALARQEAERIGERVARQKRQRAEAGIPQGGRYRPLGYDRNFQVIPEEAEIVREAFRRRAAGESTKGIATDFAKRGLRTSTGMIFQPGSTAHILRNPLYAGLRDYHGEIIGKATVEPIISEALWQATQRALKESAAPSGRNSRKHLLSGFLICGVCQQSMSGNYRSWNIGEPKQLRYVCPGTPGHTLSVFGEWVDEAIRTRVLFEVSRSVPAPETPDISAQEEAIEAEIEGIRAAFGRGELELSDLTALLADARSRKRTLLESVTIQQPPSPLDPWFDWFTLSLSERRAFLSAQIDGITLARGRGQDPRRLTLHWKNREPERLLIGRYGVVAEYGGGILLSP